MIRKLSIVALSCAALAGCHCTSNPENAMRIRVGTYNIRYGSGDRGTENAWELRRDDLAALVRKLDLDVFGMQEVQASQADFLRGKFPEYTMVGVHRDDGKRRGEASPMFFRKDRFECLKSGTFWLSKTPDVPGSKSWKTACTRVCSWAWLKDRKTGKTFCFANTHTDHRSEEAKLQGMLLIARKMKELSGGAPIVFTGDHNCHEADAPAQAISKILNDAIHCCETPVEGPWASASSPTWKYHANPISAVEAMKIPRTEFKEDELTDRHRIDYIYVSPGVKVKRYATHDDTRPGTKLHPSDHLPVTATLEI